MIRYTTLDDAFNPQKAVENTRQLLENDKVFMIFRSTGTAQTAAILPLIKEHRTLFFGSVTGASLQWLDLSRASDCGCWGQSALWTAVRADRRVGFAVG